LPCFYECEFNISFREVCSRIWGGVELWDANELLQ